MKSKLAGLLAVGLLAGTFAVPAHAVIITGAWNWTAGTYSGSFSFTGFDSTATYTNSTAAGFSATTAGFTAVAGIVFTYASGNLVIGGTPEGANTWMTTANDWRLTVLTFPATPEFRGFSYNPAVGSDVNFTTGTLTQVQVVPEPGTLALLGLGLLGFGLTRRKAA